MKKEQIYVTKPYLPDLDDFIPLLKDIWERRWLTNNGFYHQQFESQLAEYMNISNISLISNGTLALLLALKALDITGNVITTPFSFVATTHSLYLNGIEPVFADIDPVTYNLNPKEVEKKINQQTKAILPVHVFGNPCNVEEFKKLSDKYKIPVIYDAAHAFGVKINNTPLLNFGELSILSFHATKVFNTFEGGAIVCRTKETKQKIDLLKNFGFTDEITVVGPGINAKMNEFQSALGILQLRDINEVIRRRKEVFNNYQNLLANTNGITLPAAAENIQSNYSYFPILVDQSNYGLSRDDLYNLLKENGYYTRRYFYPLISHFPIYNTLPSANRQNLPVAERIAEQVLCLPIYPDIEEEIIRQISDIIKNQAL